ncbi:MAG: SDR family oxidoreductase [Opitutales bacterium]|jgi:3-oxoacyl-[acyl-carrier protein] reductase|nr:SDR family oxidoreductase [Opitutales bacterium]MDG2253403.1 SDR family oxidoreductase [Opitutaceae bacterium]MBT5167774.1 SDR family oxidoreductase [Opitutales bacterium]MBT5815490.1 SDR family oxidoreductase [Opitutales bacterium]MBT6380447.1 SDR family oxidoreductase [Opitutales bacterium]
MDIIGCSIDFTDKTALVTGSSRGIGRSIADLLSELGARVIYTGTKRFCDVASGETKEYWQMDATSRESVAECQARILDLPKLDILVNNAGINQVDSVDGLLDEDWDRVMEVNLTTPMKLMRAATKVMKNACTQGRILNVSSLFGVIGRPNRHCYTATKSGLAGITRSVALELAREGIVVNAIAPGFILTDMTKSMLSEERRRSLAEIVPMGRMGDEIEIARFAAFLVSDLNSYMIGQTVVVDGGITVSPGFH